MDSVSAPVSLSPFEEQVFQALLGRARSTGDLPSSSTGVMLYGKGLFGEEWAGEPHYRKGVDLGSIINRTYPKINLALGQLARKGLAERVQWLHAEQFGYHAGRWRLTAFGKAVAGIE